MQQDGLASAAQWAARLAAQLPATQQCRAMCPLHLPAACARTIQPSGMAVTGTTLLAASAANLSAITTSVGSTNSTPLACSGLRLRLWG